MTAQRAASARCVQCWVGVLSVALGLALAGWYFFGAKERDVPAVVATPDGAFASFRRAF